MPHAHHAAFESYWVSVALIFAALIYVRGWVRIRRRGLEAIEGWRASSFLLGLFLIWVAIASPLAALDHVLLTAHMLQHLLLMTIAAPLIWLGAPVKPLFQGLPHFMQVLAIALQWRPIQTMGSAIADPTFAWFAAAGTLIGWHIPSVFALGLQSQMWHRIEQASFLIAGLLFWLPVIQTRQARANSSEWSIILYLFLATLPCDILSGFLVFCDRVVYPVYFSSPHFFGVSALEDQQCAGALMWTCVTVIYLIAGTVVATRLLSPGMRDEHRIGQSTLRRNAAPNIVRQSMEAL